MSVCVYEWGQEKHVRVAEGAGSAADENAVCAACSKSAENTDGIRADPNTLLDENETDDDVAIGGEISTSSDFSSSSSASLS